MKEYFSHDYNARDDEKMPKLLSEVGYEGYGIYWAVVEMLYKNEGYMQLDCKSIAFALHCDSICLTKVVNDFDLFVNDNGRFYSESVLKRLGIRKDISEKRSNAAKIKWNANAEQKDNKSNAIKEKKRKENESKVNEITTNKKDKTDKKENNDKNEKKISFGDKSPYYKICLEIFYDYYTEKVGSAPQFDGAQGNHLKSIIKKIEGSLRSKNMEVTDESVYQSWKAILKNLPKWHLEKLDIKKINSDYNGIITEIQSKSGGSQAAAWARTLDEYNRR